MSEHYKIIYHIINTKTGERVCDDTVHDLTMSDPELNEPGFIREKLKITGRRIGSELLKILNKHVTKIRLRND